MGWLLDIVKLSQTAEIKCTQCGNKTVDFVSRNGRAYIRCQQCNAETEINAPELSEITDSPPLPKSLT